ncbi:MAG: hypothetical protein RRY34_10290 [Victivallaceae bacterium]
MQNKIILILGISLLAISLLFTIGANSRLTFAGSQVKIPDTQMSYDNSTGEIINTNNQNSTTPVNIFTRSRGKKIETAIAAISENRIPESDFELMAIFRHGEKFGAVINNKNTSGTSPKTSRKVFFTGDLITAGVSVKIINPAQVVLTHNGGEITLKLQKESTNAKKH